MRTMKVTDYEVFVGGFPKSRKTPLAYKTDFPVLEVFEELTAPGKSVEDGKLVESRVVHDAAELQNAMTLFEDLAVAGVEILPEEGRIRLRVRALLGSKTVMSFIPRDIHTDWAESSLLTLPETPSP